MARARLVAPKGGLVEWSLATFHASAFVLAIVFFLYSRDALGPALGGLNTLLGLALFVALWATTYLTTCRALEGSTFSKKAITGCLREGRSAGAPRTGWPSSGSSASC